jgi:ribosomal protein S18 acetylase RimI-like enzyme
MGNGDEDRQGCYIMTLGVIDECRQFGLGTMLLEHTCREIATCYTDCEIIYLHVVTYNNSAIKFYTEKNGFLVCKTEKDHYVIFEQDYDAIVLYKMLDRSYYLEPIDGEKEGDASHFVIV